MNRIRLLCPREMGPAQQQSTRQTLLPFTKEFKERGEPLLLLLMPLLLLLLLPPLLLLLLLVTPSAPTPSAPSCRQPSFEIRVRISGGAGRLHAASLMHGCTQRQGRELIRSQQCVRMHAVQDWRRAWRTRTGNAHGAHAHARTLRRWGRINQQRGRRQQAWQRQWQARKCCP